MKLQAENKQKNGDIPVEEKIVKKDLVSGYAKLQCCVWEIISRNCVGTKIDKR